MLLQLDLSFELFLEQILILVGTAACGVKSVLLTGQDELVVLDELYEVTDFVREETLEVDLLTIF